MIGTRRDRVSTADPKLPIADRTIASYPLPLSNREWAGSKVRATSSSGAPRNVAGIIFEKVLAMYAETIIEEIINGTSIGSIPRYSDRLQNIV